MEPEVFICVKQSIEILQGLKEGDRVVVSAQFLLDSESSKSSDFARMDGGEAPAGGHSPDHGMHGHDMPGHSMDSHDMRDHDMQDHGMESHDGEARDMRGHEHHHQPGSAGS